jgi:Flp pilus assembly protein TadG
MRLRPCRRSGTTLAECAVIYPLVFLFVIGLVIASLGVFRYQQLASMARRAARYAAVHGTDYARDTGNPPATAQDIYNNAVVPYAAGFDPNLLTYSVTWNQSNQPVQTLIVNNYPTPTRNTVTVTLSYQWIPETYFGGITLKSTSVVPMSY